MQTSAETTPPGSSLHSLHNGSWPFLKMHGLGNDFVLLDMRKHIEITKEGMNAERVQLLANRQLGVGCDQVVILEEVPQQSRPADCWVRFYNADGSESGACGNGTRCVGGWLLQQPECAGRDSVVLYTTGGHLEVWWADKNCKTTVTVNMGPPKIKWNEVPLSSDIGTADLGQSVEVKGYSGASAVSMGNPHCIFFVDGADSVPLAEVGPGLEHHNVFPERANISFAQVTGQSGGDGHPIIRLRVWERGSGATMCCGTAACATLTAAVRRRMIPGRKAHIKQDGGILTIEWALPSDKSIAEEKEGHPEGGDIYMTGPFTASFSGIIGADIWPFNAAAPQPVTRVL